LTTRSSPDGKVAKRQACYWFRRVDDDSRWNDLWQTIDIPKALSTLEVKQSQERPGVRYTLECSGVAEVARHGIHGRPLRHVLVRDTVQRHSHGQLEPLFTFVERRYDSTLKSWAVEAVQMIQGLSDPCPSTALTQRIHLILSLRVIVDLACAMVDNADMLLSYKTLYCRLIDCRGRFWRDTTATAPFLA
jgi:hypothetical protein